MKIEKMSLRLFLHWMAVYGTDVSCTDNGVILQLGEIYTNKQ